MNETVKKMVEIVFRDTEHTEEVQILYEQVLMDCQDRFEELVNNGMDEDEAIAAVVESLKGMEEVLREYPARTPVEQESEEKAPLFSGSRKDMSADAVNSMLVSIENHHVYIRPSEDRQVHVYTEAKEIEMTSNGTEIRVVQRPQEQSGIARFIRLIGMGDLIGEPLYVELPEQSQMSAEIKTTIGEIHWEGVSMDQAVLKTSSGNIEIHSKPCAVRNMEIRSTSGDVRLHDTAETDRIAIHTTSGDIEGSIASGTIEAHALSGDINLYGKAGALRADTLSGDLELSGRYDTVCCKSMSGDIEGNLEAEDVTAGSTSGDIHLKGKMQNMKLQSTSGDLTASAETLAMECTTSSGDVVMDARKSSSLKSIRAGTHSGEVRLHLPENMPVRIHMESRSGEVKSFVPETQDEMAPTVDIRTISGDIHIQ